MGADPGRRPAALPGRSPVDAAPTPRRLTFGAHAGAYERARPAWPEEAARWFVPPDARLVVELGAGTGKLTRSLAAVAPSVLAVEPDPRMLAVLREHGLEGAAGVAAGGGSSRPHDGGFAGVVCSPGVAAGGGSSRPHDGGFAGVVCSPGVAAGGGSSRPHDGGFAGVVCSQGSAEAIPLADGEADAVVAGSCLHWFELGPALAEIHRVLRPGGRFAFGWNHRDDRHPTIAAMSAAIYASRPSRLTSGWRRRDWTAAVVDAGLFRDVERAEFPHVHELPRVALDDHLRSYSGLASLEQMERAHVFERVAAILDADSSLSRGDRLALPFVVDAYRTVRHP